MEKKILEDAMEKKEKKKKMIDEICWVDRVVLVEAGQVAELCTGCDYISRERSR